MHPKVVFVLSTSPSFPPPPRKPLGFPTYTKMWVKFSRSVSWWYGCSLRKSWRFLEFVNLKILPSCKLTVRHGKSTILMVFTRKDGDFHGRNDSLPEGNSTNYSMHVLQNGKANNKKTQQTFSLVFHPFLRRSCVTGIYLWIETAVN